MQLLNYACYKKIEREAAISIKDLTFDLPCHLENSEQSESSKYTEAKRIFFKL